MNSVTRFATKFLIVSLSLVSLSLPAFAASGFAGKWEGAGEWTFQGSGVSCNMDIAFSETATEFKRISGYFDCDIVALTSYELSLQIDGEKLLLDGVQVGSMRDNFVQFSEAYDETVNITTTLEVKNNLLYYKEIWMDGDQELYVITGGFKLKN